MEWHTPLFLADIADLCEFEASMIYVVSPSQLKCLVRCCLMTNKQTNKKKIHNKQKGCSRPDWATGDLISKRKES